jgi:hypothetical protein
MVLDDLHYVLVTKISCPEVHHLTLLLVKENKRLLQLCLLEELGSFLVLEVRGKRS